MTRGYLGWTQETIMPDSTSQESPLERKIEDAQVKDVPVKPDDRDPGGPIYPAALYRGTFRK